jgi:cysteine-rich repeat protein/Cys-rich repeat protein
MLLACSSCPGLVPEALDACPHCGARSIQARSSGAPTPIGAGTALKRLAALATGGAAMMLLMACYGYIDDGYYDDGFVGCSTDADCPSGQVCDAWSGACQSPTTSSTGTGTGFETYCADQADDDFDGLVDCEDPDCTYAEACTVAEICQNGADDDMDGYLDCEDTDCPSCPPTETWCGNLVDDDLDGQLDCDDPDCASECGVTVCGDGLQVGNEECDDGDLEDGDGCSSLCTVELDVFCAALPPLVIGTNASTNVDGTNALSSSCVPPGGREVAYDFTALADGTLSVSVDSTLGIGVYVLDGCGEAAPELGCSAGGEEVTVPLLTGATVTVVVDGAGEREAGDFVLSASFTPN